MDAKRVAKLGNRLASSPITTSKSQMYEEIQPIQHFYQQCHLACPHGLQSWVNGVDPSYRLLTLAYADGTTNQVVKNPLPYTLERVQKGDEVVLRVTQGWFCA